MCTQVYMLERHPLRLHFAFKLQLTDRMLSKTAEYALRAVACMGSQVDRPVSANLLAEQTKVPRRYLTRVLQDLCASGIVKSRPGPGGGYELTHATSKVTILDVINTVAPIARIKNWLAVTTNTFATIPHWFIVSG